LPIDLRGVDFLAVDFLAVAAFGGDFLALVCPKTLDHLDKRHNRRGTAVGSVSV
jgi:hypothetical protein